jgi:hypothetical protein
MRIPDPKPMRLTPRARVLRQVSIFEAMVRDVRTRPLPRKERGCGWASRDMGPDLALCETLDLAIQRGRALADRLARGTYGLSRDLTDFIDLAYVVKLDFFQARRDADAWSTP